MLIVPYTTVWMMSPEMQAPIVMLVPLVAVTSDPSSLDPFLYTSMYPTV